MHIAIDASRCHRHHAFSFDNRPTNTTLKAAFAAARHPEGRTSHAVEHFVFGVARVAAGVFEIFGGGGGFGGSGRSGRGACCGK